MELTNEKFIIYIEHMLHHNRHHCEDIAEAAANAVNLGKDEVASLLREAKALQDQANEKLQAAVERAKKVE